jgi:N-acetyl-anhydromuramyl-L-alanine amidase AmpD|tara:strand:+ start:5350 stop:6051 length:702 start_codon:yes stop_codon:yes gene_type:complete
MTIIQEFTNLTANAFNLIRPYFMGRNRSTTDINTVVLHWAASTNLISTINTLQSKRYGYHFLIDKNGQVYQGSPLNKRVSHAGSSYGPKGKFVNSYSIGISFLVSGTGGPDDFTEEMYDSCVALIKDVKLKIPTIKFITGHHWVSPGRKIDPYTLKWDLLMNKLGNGYELWKTGYAPFPEGLSKCDCKEYFPNSRNCKKSIGPCADSEGYGYSERKLSTEVSSLSYQSDLDTE